MFDVKAENSYSATWQHIISVASALIKMSSRVAIIKHGYGSLNSGFNGRFEASVNDRLVSTSLATIN
jgi:hypothetical protein